LGEDGFAADYIVIQVNEYFADHRKATNTGDDSLTQVTEYPLLAGFCYTPQLEPRGRCLPVSSYSPCVIFSDATYCYRPTAVMRESRPLWRCWLSSRQYREYFTYTDLRMKPLCALRPQTNTPICLNYGVTLTPTLMTQILWAPNGVIGFLPLYANHVIMRDSRLF
jgi:hypothetical protein